MAKFRQRRDPRAKRKLDSKSIVVRKMAVVVELRLAGENERFYYECNLRLKYWDTRFISAIDGVIKS
jgi:hypothetical protein